MVIGLVLEVSSASTDYELCVTQIEKMSPYKVSAATQRCVMLTFMPLL